jgi:diacylglycerol kinase family enzyme
VARPVPSVTSPGDAPRPIPALLNCRAGAAAAAAQAIARDDRFELHELEPIDLEQALRREVQRGARRVLICGGDGSIATAARSLAGTGVELAVLPGGTLNHFARDFGIPSGLSDALDVAAGSFTRSVDVGEVNGRLFLNTFSVGSYVRFVRRRERLEHWMGYKAASFLASMLIFGDLRSYLLVVQAGDALQRYISPLVFVGVGERDTTVPLLGSRKEGGAPGLHALVVRSRARARIVAVALAAVARGVERVSRTPALDSFIVPQCTIDLYRHDATVALDGEVVKLATPLELRLVPDAITLVTSAPSAAATAQEGREGSDISGR